ncbi:MAG: hypothetical protein M3N29_05385 [Chloroflexota bacterium]|nr:hypothetical protein [Chloroflexota bacterium]
MSTRQRRTPSPRGRQAGTSRQRNDEHDTRYYTHPYARRPGYYPPNAYEDDDEYADDRPAERGGRLVTPTRFLLALAVIGSAAASFYGLFVARSLPITVSSLAVLGISAALLGLAVGAASVRAGRNGQAGRAILVALIGGVLVLGAAGSLAAALVLGLLAASA